MSADVLMVLRHKQGIDGYKFIHVPIAMWLASDSLCNIVGSNDVVWNPYNYPG